MKNIRLKFNKKDDLIYISHLDLMRMFQRVFRRSGIMLKHTEGFNPQPKIAFATALALGTESDGEYMDIELEEDIELGELLDRLNDNLPSGIKILAGAEKTEKDSVMSLIEWGDYLVDVRSKEEYPLEHVKGEIEKMMALDEIIEVKEKKKKGKVTAKEVNIRQNIKSLDAVMTDKDHIVFDLLLKTGSNGNLKPDVVIEKLAEHTGLDLDLSSLRIRRKDLYLEKEGQISTPI